MDFSTPHPAIDLNAVFNDEGESTLGWVTTASTIASTGGWTTVTKSSGSVTAGAVKAIVPPAKDLLLYGKTKANRLQNDCQCVRIYNSAAKGIEVWWNNDLPAGTKVLDTVCIGGWKGATWNRAVCMTDWNSEDEMEWLLWYDSKNGTVGFYTREDDKWIFKNRVECDAPNGEIRVQLGGSSAASAWIKFDYLSVCRPNFFDATDSGGDYGFSDSNLSLSDHEYRWSRYAAIAPGLRNNFVVFKATAGQNSTQILARLDNDVLKQGPRVVFFHCGNDFGAGLTIAQRTANVQAIVNAINNSGAHAVVLNANYAVAGDGQQPNKRNYFRDSWADIEANVTGAFAIINTMEAVWDNSDDQFLQDQYASNPPTDSHMTPSGQQAFGEFVASA